MDVTGQRSFALGHCLGRGGFGEVYRATMSSAGGLSREVAVKLLRSDLDMHDDAVRRLRDEGRLVSRLDHPALVRVYDLVELAGRVALVTEFIDGEDLTECFRARPPMPQRALLQAIGQVAEALHVAWTAPLGPQGRALHLVHRDIKPSNLRVGRHGEVKVLDFGIARSDEVARESRTSTDLIIGSPAYMAPERFLDNDVRSASDIFALGCCLYEGLTGGERLFGGQSAMVLSTLALDATRYYEFLEKRPLPAHVGQELRDLVHDCLHHDPSDRPTATQLAHACDELADSVGGQSLRRWAKQREWPTGNVGIPSVLAGQVVTEGSLALSREPTERVPEKRGVWVWLMGSAAAGVAVVSVLGVALVIAFIAWQQSMGSDAALAQSATVDGSAPAAELIGAADTGLPSPAPAPTAQVAAPDVAPLTNTSRVAPTDPAPAGVMGSRDPDSTVRTPEPVVEPVPEPIVVRVPPPRSPPRPDPVPRSVTTQVSLSGDALSVWLSKGGTRVTLSARGAIPIPVGTWTLHLADGVGGSTTHGTVALTEGNAVTIHCSQSMSSCRVR